MKEEQIHENEQAAAPVTSRATVLLGVTGTVDSAIVQPCLQEIGPVLNARVIVAAPNLAEATENDVHFRSYPLTAGRPENLPWVNASFAQRAICSLAAEVQADVCVLLHGDLILLNADVLPLFIQPVLEKRCDVVLPVYAAGKFDGLLNHGILAPLARALFGQRVRYPLPLDFSCSAEMCAKFTAPHPAHDPNADEILWPATIAAVAGKQVCQVNVDASHGRQTDGIELRTALASLVGSAFIEMEKYASFWQRIRGSRATPVTGHAVKQASESDGIDVKPLIDSFLLGARNLQEIWGPVLPPVTLFELKRLSRAPLEEFRMPDELWVRILYDFALAHRLRSISRSHLLGALTPLYLGWVASYVQEAANLSPFAAEQRLEQLARAYEENKPYLLRRWRWPDRFNP
ncbi:MAG TPA: hypothetical protein VKX41_17995 [Alloacidobacterium sp.]|jgi:hypothetical protein|nr:hypothetical protein [Alloacidobacterium sp.]